MPSPSKLKSSSAFRELSSRLTEFERKHGSLPGLASTGSRETFLLQLADSVRRVDYVRSVAKGKSGATRCDPKSDDFDPLKAIAYFARNGNIEEACWLAYLVTYFGLGSKSRPLIRRVYGRLGGEPWTWKRVSSNPSAFVTWLENNAPELKHGTAFGNHRKFETLKAGSRRGAGASLQSYVRWVGKAGHQAKFDHALQSNDNDPNKAFESLFKTLKTVASFGRLAKFDYLNLLEKMGLANVVAATPQLVGSSGPLKGARVIFGATKDSSRVLDAKCAQLANALGVGMQEMEDALCNWNKSRSVFKHFGG